jgi:mannose-6-phosphate isomerase-like protein (cupin superfamily)
MKSLGRRLGLLWAIAIPVFLVAAQESLLPGFELWTPASLKQYEQKMRDDAAADPHHFAVQQVADFPSDSALLVHREGDGPPEWHETQADIFFVQYGTATLLVGGTLLNGETVSPHEKRNGTIQGGVRRRLAAGDVVRIPPRIPHQVLLEGAHEFNYFVIKIKGY